VAVQIRSCGCGLGLGGTELWLWAEPATNPARAQAERSDLVCDHEFKVFQTLLDHPGLFASGPILEQAWIVHPIDYNRPHCSCSFTWQPLEVSRRTYSRAGLRYRYWVQNRYTPISSKINKIDRKSVQIQISNLQMVKTCFNR
jgi:hypothetical protein